MLVGHHEYAVIGSPIAHSLSPLIHQYFARNAGIELTYKKYEVKPSNFTTFVYDFFSSGGRGLNITAPLKSCAYALAHEKTPTAHALKNANTLWHHNQLIKADNTDKAGFYQELVRLVPKGVTNALVIGAGSTAKSIVAALKDYQCTNIAIFNRRMPKIDDLRLIHTPLLRFDDARICEPYDLIVNAASFSLSLDLLQDIPFIWQSTSKYYDISYRMGRKSAFLEKAAYMGAPTYHGFGMLVEQAAQAFYCWHGVKPPTMPLIQKITLAFEKGLNLRF